MFRLDKQVPQHDNSAVQWRGEGHWKGSNAGAVPATDPAGPVMVRMSHHGALLTHNTSKDRIGSKDNRTG